MKDYIIYIQLDIVSVNTYGMLLRMKAWEIADVDSGSEIMLLIHGCTLQSARKIGIHLINPRGNQMEMSLAKRFFPVYR